jgi:hypothetical protein
LRFFAAKRHLLLNWESQIAGLTPIPFFDFFVSAIIATAAAVFERRFQNTA